MSQLIAEGHTLGILVALLAATHLFASVASRDARGLGVLRTRALQRLGTVSYSFYLAHPIVMFGVKNLVVRFMPEAHGSWAATTVFAIGSALLSALLSYLSYRWLEQGLARWLKARWHGGDVPVRRSDAEPRTERA